jgi:hypothetical protein
VRRAEPARDDGQVGAQRLRERGRQLVLVVAYDRDPRRLEPEPRQLPREEGTVAVVPVAADQLAAGDDDVTTQIRCRAA